MKDNSEFENMSVGQLLDKLREIKSQREQELTELCRDYLESCYRRF